MFELPHFELIVSSMATQVCVYACVCLKKKLRILLAPSSIEKGIKKGMTIITLVTDSF